MECPECGKKIGKFNIKYCSVLCRNIAVSKLPRKTYRRTYMICQECGKQYLIRNSQVYRSKYCSKHCMGIKMKRDSNANIYDIIGSTRLVV